ncbi:MAG TPA: hypothetical protein VNS46_07660 [Nocardioides sp.]|nr:hypothetical protein [Nocardioides sp.]
MTRTAAARPLRRHLTPPATLSRAVARPAAAPSRSPGHGNGVRVHAIYFAVVSLAGLLLVLAAAAMASTR